MSETHPITPLERDPDHHTHPVQPSNRYRAEQLPARVDLRPHMPPVYNQGQLGSCTANALGAAYGYLEGRVAKRIVDVSRLFIWYNERNMEGKATQNAGAKIRDGVSVLQSYGACEETIWPYDATKFSEKPVSAAYDQGKGHEIDQAATVAVDLHAMKHCLAEGYPFVFGLVIDPPNFKPDAKGVVARSAKADGKNSHAMLAVGYDDARKAFIVRNSWGPAWGDKGYWYASYDWMTDPKAAFDMWTLRRGHGLDFSVVDADDDDSEEEDDETEEDETDDDADDTSEDDSDDETDDDDDDSEDEDAEDDDSEEDDSDDDDDEDDESDDDSEEDDSEEDAKPKKTAK